MSVPNGYTAKEWSDLHGKSFKEESRTRQEFVKECDINRVMAQYHRTGMLSHVREHMGEYMDLTETPESFVEAQQQIAKATEFFMGLPSNIRARFLNNAGEFLDFISDRENLDEMRELGLIPAEQNGERSEPPAPPEPATGDPIAEGSEDG